MILAAAVVLTVVGAALSIFLYLPALAVAESLSPRRASARAAIWFCALVIPILAGALCAAIGLMRVTGDPYASPHLTAGRPHLCAKWLGTLPDARWLVTLGGSMCFGLVIAGAVRTIFRAVRSCWAVRRFGPTLAGSDRVAVIASPTVFIGTVGLLRPITITTQATQMILDEDELRAVMAHEAQHVRRRDNIAELLVGACVTCLVFVPTVHLFARYWREEVERACDDAAAHRQSPEAVCSAMVKLAQVGEREARQRIVPPVQAVWREAAADVQRRVARLLQPEAGAEDNPPGDVTIIGVVLTAGALTALALGIAATGRQVGDTIHCLSETLLSVLRYGAGSP